MRLKITLLFLILAIIVSVYVCWHYTAYAHVFITVEPPGAENVILHWGTDKSAIGNVTGGQTADTYLERQTPHTIGFDRLTVIYTPMGKTEPSSAEIMIDPRDPTFHLQLFPERPAPERLVVK